MRKEYTEQDVLDFISYATQGDKVEDQWPNREVFEEWKVYRRKATDSIPWIDEWLDMWPGGIKSGGKLVKSDKVSTEKRMSAFLKMYPEFGKEIIMEATQKYLEQKEVEDWMYTRCAVYFIGKRGEGSDLAAHCYQLLEAYRSNKIEEEYNRYEI